MRNHRHRITSLTFSPLSRPVDGTPGTDRGYAVIVTPVSLGIHRRAIDIADQPVQRVLVHDLLAVEAQMVLRKEGELGYSRFCVDIFAKDEDVELCRTFAVPFSIGISAG